MRSSPATKTVLAVGILAAAAAAIVFKSAPAPASGDAASPSGPVRSVSPPPPGKSPARPGWTATSLAESASELLALEELAARDPRQALVKLAGLRDSEALSPALAAVARGWARRDPQAAADWVAGLDSEEKRTDAALGLIPAWAASAPVDCLAWAAARAPGDLRELSLVELADTWSSGDPAQALARFLALPADDGSERGLHAIVSQWALDAPQAAVESLSAMDSASRRDELLQAALVSLSNQDPDLTWHYSDRFDDPETVEHVRSMALEAMAETRPQDALRLAAAAGNGEPLLAAIARGWAGEDDAAAKAWIASLPDAELSARLLQVVTE